MVSPVWLSAATSSRLWAASASRATSSTQPGLRWINPAAEQLLGDIRGRHFTSVVAPEDSRRARELFAQKMLGTSPATDTTGVLVSTAGTRVPVELSSVPLMNGERVVGVFGLLEGLPDASPQRPTRI